MIPWELSRRNPIIDLRMVATRQFGACFLVMLATGAILLATTQFLPQLVQQDFGYTATWAGLVLSPGGVVTMVMMFVVGRLAAKVQPKYLIVAGAVIIALSMYDMTNVYGDLGFWFMARSRMLLGVGLPLIFVPIMAASYDGIPPSKTDQASALINAARNTGGSIGVSIVSNVLTHREQFHQSRLVEQVIPSSAQYQDTLQQITNYFTAHGSSLAQAHDQAIQWIGAAGAGAGVVPGLHGCVLGADADLAFRRAARADPAQGQARRSCPRWAIEIDRIASFSANSNQGELHMLLHLPIAILATLSPIHVSDTVPTFDIVRECRYEGGSTANCRAVLARRNGGTGAAQDGMGAVCRCRQAVLHGDDARSAASQAMLSC